MAAEARLAAANSQRQRAVAAGAAFEAEAGQPNEDSLLLRRGALWHWSRQWNVTRTEVSNGGSAIAIDGFLPPRLAARWHSELMSTWTSAGPCRERQMCVGSSCLWRYTTNVPHSSRKIRSVYQRQKRRNEVEAAYRGGIFSYSKWELAASHRLYEAVGALMERDEVRELVRRALRIPLNAGPMGNITDYFVTAFANNDFLSTHNDAAAGSAAFVYHLADWQGGQGGELRFNRGRCVWQPPAPRHAHPARTTPRTTVTRGCCHVRGASRAGPRAIATSGLRSTACCCSSRGRAQRRIRSFGSTATRHVLASPGGT
eukprot:4083008-Prymnesium_polylepis.2